MSRPLDVLVVDDSPFARRAIVRMLEAEPGLRVTGQASSGEEALAALAGGGRYDAMTLDLDMPGLGGLGTLERMLQGPRVPVVIVSGAAQRDAARTLQALELGAVDVVAKPAGSPLALHDVGAELRAKVRAAAGRAEVPAPGRPGAIAPARGVAPPPRGPVGRVGLVVIGTSTGGPAALLQLLPALPADFPAPVVVCQHMPPGYTAALAARLDRRSAIGVLEATDGAPLLPGHVLVAPSGRQLGFRTGPAGLAAVVSDACPIPSYYRPSIDHTFGEAAAAAGPAVLAVVLTGMGSDGAVGLRAVKAAGGACWAQDEATSVIYGMPRAAAETGVLDAVIGLPDLADALQAFVLG